MTTLEKLEKRLRGCRDLSFRIDGNTIFVAAPSEDGFSIAFTAGRGQFTVAFEGWHEEFDSEEQAILCFAFGLSDLCRLKVVRLGDRDCRWTVEHRTGRGWEEDSTIGPALFPFWRRRVVIYRQNRVIKSARKLR